MRAYGWALRVVGFLIGGVLAAVAGLELFEGLVCWLRLRISPFSPFLGAVTVKESGNERIVYIMFYPLYAFPDSFAK